MTISIGIDPDVTDLSIASWTSEGPGSAMVVHAIGKGQGEQSQARMARLLMDTDPGLFFHDCRYIAIEGQQIDGRAARAADLFTLAHVTGAAIAWCAAKINHEKILVPTPAQWKGSVAKHAMQARMYTDLGWGYTLHGSGKSRYAQPSYPPSRFNHIKPAQWKHVGDALLLARWAHQQ